MTVAAEMLRTHSKDGGQVDQKALVDCIKVCTPCADGYPSEEMLAELTKCNCTNLDCADLCETTARIQRQR